MKVWDKLKEEELSKLNTYNEEYKEFLNSVKTEREATSYLLENFKENGYKDLQAEKLNFGDKFYFNHRDKVIISGIINEELKNGFKFLGSHIDAPRLDLKGNPLKEENNLLMMKTHYYGGIKKYQWATIPLSLRGVLYKRDGSKINVRIGDKKGDIFFTITDLLPHLGKEQLKETMNKGINGEQLNILVGSIPKEKNEKKNNEADRVTQHIKNILLEEYNIENDDFLRSELEVVPAFDAVDIGLDRSMIGAYGQDDRICAFATYKAFEEGDIKEKNVICAYFDKEEIGSNGDTGAKSRILEYVVQLLIKNFQEDVVPLEVFYQSKGLSADVSALDDPNYQGLFDNNNRALIGDGIVISKYTGSGGKYDANDASAEFLSQVLNNFLDNDILFQCSELGKVDQGGGGTIAQHISELGMEVLDVGPGLLSMHSPFEVVSKGDNFMTYKAYKAFIEV